MVKSLFGLLTLQTGMVSKTSLGLIGVGLLVLVSASKQIGSFFGQVGSSVGTSLSMGLQDFVSALNPLAGAQQQMQQMMQPNDMQQQMQQQMQAMTTPNPTENGNQALLGGVGTTSGAAAIMMGAADSLLKMGAPNPELGATNINTSTLQSFFDMLTSMFPNVENQIPTIADTLNTYLQAGGKSISDFAANFKFPSGQTLDEILGSASKLGEVPEAGAMLGGSSLTNPPSDLVKIMTMIAPKMMQGIDTVMYAPNNQPIPLSELLNMSPAKMLSMMNLNIDQKVDTPYGVITYGSSAGSVGAGAGTILKPTTLTQVLQQNPNLNASEAADVLAMINNSLPSNFDFGTNTGGGSIEMFNAMMKVIPSSVMESPALLAYENYKAEYGLM